MDTKTREIPMHDFILGAAQARNATMRKMLLMFDVENDTPDNKTDVEQSQNIHVFY